MATHAVLTSASTAFRDLGLAVVDEEQRFGVEQRDKLTGAPCGLSLLYRTHFSYAHACVGVIWRRCNFL